MQNMAKANFTALESVYGTPLLVSIQMIRSIFKPKALYGCETFDINVGPPNAPMNTALNRIYKKALNCYSTDSREKVFKFVGHMPLARTPLGRQPDWRPTFVCLVSCSNFSSALSPTFNTF